MSAPAAPPAAVNRVVALVLRSPAHRLLSGRVLELRWTGPRTGRRRATPLQYAERDGGLVLLGWRERRWWRAFRGEGAPVEVLLRGRVRRGHARVADATTQERADVLRALSGRRAPAPGEALARADDAVVVRVTLDAGS